jgi:hypothetical protein
MIAREVHPKIHVRVLRARPAFSSCHECHRSFHAKNEDQLCLELCDSCFDAARKLREPIIRVHVKPRPCRPVNV